jgi:hypothetical protein
VSLLFILAILYDEDILHYYPLAKTQQKKAKWSSCSWAATVWASE